MRGAGLRDRGGSAPAVGCRSCIDGRCRWPRVRVVTRLGLCTVPGHRGGPPAGGITRRRRLRSSPRGGSWAPVVAARCGARRTTGAWRCSAARGGGSGGLEGAAHSTKRGRGRISFGNDNKIEKNKGGRG